jgi:hypothetical protein
MGFAALATIAGCDSRSVASDGGGDATDSSSPPGPIGAPCTSADECASRTCRDGICAPLPIDALDLLLVIDNSGGMSANQTNLLMQLGPLIEMLVSPRCVSPSNPTPHVCDRKSDPGDVPEHLPVQSLHLGVVSTDLGTPGSTVPGCANSDLGDDALLNPIRNGQALSRHEPWTIAPPTFPRPTDCADPNQFPSFITFRSYGTDAMQFTHDAMCNAGLYVNGCGLESPLDAMYRALILHDARDVVSNDSPNAGFLREQALLAIVVLTDEEDGSVRDCRFANGSTCDGVGALDVYESSSTAWASNDLNLRFYMYQPCGPQDRRGLSSATSTRRIRTRDCSL